MQDWISSNMALSALALYALWVGLTYLLEGRLLTLRRPEAAAQRAVYALVANILVGIVVAGWVLHALSRSGVRSTDELLKQGATPQGRAALATKSGVKPELILEWVNHTDLYRIKGVGSEYADLLEAAGVDTVPELARRNAENLFKKMVEVNDAKKLVRRLPLDRQVAGWIEQAKKLERVIKY